MEFDENISVRVSFSADAGNIGEVIDNVRRQITQLTITAGKMAEITGKMVPGLDQQVLLLRGLAAEGNKAAEALVNSVRGQQLFYTAFSGNVKQNLAALFRNEVTYKNFFNNLREEFRNTLIVSDQAGRGMTTVAEDAALRWRLAGAVITEHIARISNRMITLGKQAQWVGRQLIVGVTAPVLLTFRTLSKYTFEQARAEAELTKFMIDFNTNAEEAAQIVHNKLVPALQEVAIETATAQEETIRLAASWKAAGFENEQMLATIVKLTQQLYLLTQGDLKLAEAQELLRSIMATYFDQTDKGVRATEKVIHQLQFIQSITSLQMADMAKALPLVSSVAKTLGIMPGEIAAMLAGMRQLGVQAPVAANALKFGLARLAEPTGEAAQRFEELTGTTLGEVLFKGGRPRGIQAIQELASIFQQLNEEQRIQLASLLFGNRQYDRFLKLIQAIRTPTSDFHKALKASRDETQASAYWQEQLNAILNNVATQWQQLIIRMKIFAARLGELVIPKLLTAAEAFNKMLDALNKLPDSIKNTIVNLVSLAAALGPIIYSLAFITKLVPGNILNVLPLLGRKFFGVRGTENPDLIERLAERFPLLNIPAGFRQTGKMLPKEAAGYYQQLLGMIVQQLPEGTEIPATRILGLGPEELGHLGLGFVNRETLTKLAAPEGGYIPPTKWLRDLGVRLVDDTSAAISGEIIEGATDAAAVARQTFLQRGNIIQQILRKAPEGVQIPVEQLARLQPEALVAMAAGAVDQSTLAMLSRDVRGRFVSTKWVKELGISTVEDITQFVSQDVIEGMQEAASTGVIAETVEEVAERTTRIDVARKSIFQRIRDFYNGLFGKREVVAITAGGRLDFTAILLNFTRNILPQLTIAIGAALAIMQNWRDVWKGLAPYIDKVVKIFAQMGERLIKIITGVFDDDKIKENSDLWERFGEIIGKILLTITKVIDVLSTPVMATIGVVLKVLMTIFEGIAAALLLVTGRFKEFGDMMNQGVGIAKVGWGVFRVLGIAIATAFSISKVIAWLKLFTQVKQAFMGATAAGITFKSVMIGINAAISSIGFKGWLGIIVGITAAVITLKNIFSRTSVSAEQLASSLSDLSKSMAEFIKNAQTLKLRTDREEFIASFNAILDELQSRIIDINRQFESLNIAEWEKLEVIANALIPVMAQINELTDNQINLIDELIKKRQQELELEMTILRETIRAFTERREAIRAEIYMIENPSPEEAARRVSLMGADYLAEMEMQLERIGLLRRQDEMLTEQINDMVNQIESLELMARVSGDVFDRVLASFADERFANNVENARNRLQGLYEVLARGIPITGTAKESLDNFASALENQLSQATSRFVEAALVSFDAQTESMVNSVQRQIDAIDEQIAKIEELNEKEEQLQRDREYRQRRAEMLRRMELTAATAAIERLIAIHKGEFDQAKLIALQAASDIKQQRKDLENLEKDRQAELAARRREQRIETLRKRQESLREEIQRIEEARRKQRAVLENMLEDVTEFAARTVGEWRKMRDNILDVVDKYGVDINDISKTHLQTFGRTLKQELRDALSDAKIEAERQAQEVGRKIGEGMARGAVEAGKLKQLGDLMEELDNLTRMWESRRFREGFTSKDMLEMFQEWWNEAKKILRNITPPSFHSGGYVSGSTNDVPAVLERGEYVISRKVVSKIGKQTLDRLNDEKGWEPIKFHEGGFVDIARYGATQAMMAASSYGAAAINVAVRIGELIGVKMLDVMKIGLKSLVKSYAAETGVAYGKKGVIAEPVEGRGPLMVFPVAGNNYSYSDTFGAPRPGGRIHQGIDIIAPMGTPVLATFPGKVVKTPNTLGGLAVKVFGKAGYTYNAHLSRYANVSGVQAGQVVGYVGNTGNAIYSVPHLHFEWHPGNGPAVNPYQYLRAVDPKLNPKLATGGIVKFDTPALLHSGEAVIPKSVTQALSRAGSAPPVVNINMTVEGDIYGDESSYRRLYETLERVGKRIGIQRGENNIMVKVR